MAACQAEHAGKFRRGIGIVLHGVQTDHYIVTAGDGRGSEFDIPNAVSFREAPAGIQPVLVDVEAVDVGSAGTRHRNRLKPWSAPVVQNGFAPN